MPSVSSPTVLRLAASSSTAVRPCSGRRTSTAASFPAAKHSRRSSGRSPSGQEWRPHRSTDHDRATAEPTSSTASPRSVARSCAGTREPRRAAYLEERGLPAGAIDHAGLGVVPRELFTKNALEAAGYSELEIAQSGVLADGRWPGRLCGAWRDERGTVRTLWARSLRDSDSSTRYLYLRGASRSGLPPYGLSDVLRLPPSERSELLLVEGLIDVHHLQAKGLPNVAAVGGARLNPDLIPRIGRLGFETIVLAFDNDAPGREGISHAVEHASRAKEAPTLRVLEPKQLGDSKDPDAFVREHGIEKFRALVAQADCAISWHALELTRGVTPQHDTPSRRAALARAGSWLGTLPARLSLEQEDAVRRVADQCGYSQAAVERAFRARFWDGAERRVASDW